MISICYVCNTRKKSWILRVVPLIRQPCSVRTLGCLGLTQLNEDIRTALWLRLAGKSDYWWALAFVQRSASSTPFLNTSPCIHSWLHLSWNPNMNPKVFPRYHWTHWTDGLTSPFQSRQHLSGCSFASKVVFHGSTSAISMDHIKIAMWSYWRGMWKLTFTRNQDTIW